MASFLSPAAFTTWQPYYSWCECLLSPMCIFVLFARMNGSPKGIIPKRNLRGWLKMQMADVPPRHLRTDNYVFLKNPVTGETGGQEMEGNISTSHSVTEVLCILFWWTWFEHESHLRAMYKQLLIDTD